MYKNGRLLSICIAPTKGAPMQEITEVMAIEGRGLEGDRYANAQGSWNDGELGKRQVTFISNHFVESSGFAFKDTRRTCLVEQVELMLLIGKEFDLGEARFEGVKYCDPCERPNTLIQSPQSFWEAFTDRGGLIARVIKSGIIRVNDALIPPPRKWQ